MTADTDDDLALLTKFERENLIGHYRQRVINKRHNWNVNLSEFRPLWNCFMLIDKIWTHELELMSEGITDEKEVFPYLLFGAAHAKTQVVIDLLFSDYVTEAYSIMREVIEFVVHGYRLLSRPDLLEVWCNRGDDATSLARWKEEFWFAKEQKLFDGLLEEYLAWKLCSNVGSHAHVGSLLARYYATGPDTVQWALHYSGVSPDRLPLMLFAILQVLSNLECRMFESVESHLTSDSELLRLRDKFREDKEATRIFMKVDLEMDAFAANFKTSEPPSL